MPNGEEEAGTSAERVGITMSDMDEKFAARNFSWPRCFFGCQTVNAMRERRTFTD